MRHFASHVKRYEGKNALLTGTIVYEQKETNLAQSCSMQPSLLPASQRQELQKTIDLSESLMQEIQPIPYLAYNLLCDSTPLLFGTASPSESTKLSEMGHQYEDHIITKRCCLTFFLNKLQ